MKKRELEIKKSSYIAFIVQSLRMEINDFLDRVYDGDQYESTIYTWTVLLYEEGKSKEEAVRLILNRRMAIINAASFNTKKQISQNYEKSMQRLSEYTNYKKLNTIQQEMIKKRAYELAKTDLYSISDLIFYILEIVNDMVGKKNDHKYSLRTAI